MSIDPRTLVEQARPQSAVPLGQPVPGALRRARETIIEDHEGNPRSVHEMDGTNPAVYKSRIPPPPCGFCGQDHNPIGEATGKYGHPYVHPDDEEKITALGGAVSPQTLVQTTSSPPPATTSTASSSQRVSIMPARGGDDYVVGVEHNPPEWDLEDSWKLTTDELLKFLPILRLLGIKIRDNTGGELAARELERRGH